MRCSLCDYSPTEVSMFNPASGNRKRAILIVDDRELCSECVASIAFASHFEDAQERESEEDSPLFPDTSDEEGVENSK